MIRVRTSGSFKNTDKFFKEAPNLDYISIFHRYGERGVQALSTATPKDTGLTASSWSYKVVESRGRIELSWYNSNVTSGGVPVVILIQYGHGVRGGGYVQGRDFINPVTQRIFDDLAEELWREVTRL